MRKNPRTIPLLTIIIFLALLVCVDLFRSSTTGHSIRDKEIVKADAPRMPQTIHSAPRTYIRNEHLTYGAWVTRWGGNKGIQDAVTRIDNFDTLSPFSFEIAATGKVQNVLNMSGNSWKPLRTAADAHDVDIIPSFLWMDAKAMHTVLTDSEKRTHLAQEIAKTTSTYMTEGVDIDFEWMENVDRPQFVLFLTTLKEILGEKLLTCTIEAKLPGANPETSTSDAAFYTSLNTICDEVRVMAYDMRFSDMAFAVIQQAPYIPSADVRTVKKSIDYISTYIAPSKLVLGVALYGYEYEVTETSTSTSYKLLWSFSPSYIPQLLSKVHGSIVRGESGEAYITYTTDAQGKPSPSFRETAPFVAATSSGKNSTYRVAWWSDNTAVEKKTELAKMMGLKGVSLFRLDGDTEEGLWELLK